MNATKLSASPTAPGDEDRRMTRPERRAQAERRLLAAAREIVAVKGWVGMTLADVGAAAGYSRGLAAHHFGSKGGLLRALVHHLDANLKADLNAAPARDAGLDALRGFVTTYLGREHTGWTNTRALLLLMAEALIEGNDTGETLARYNEHVVGFLEHQVRAGMASGEIRSDINPGAAAALIMGALRGVMLQKLTRHSKLNVREVRDQLLDLITASLAAGPRPAPPGREPLKARARPVPRKRPAKA